MSGSELTGSYVPCNASTVTGRYMYNKLFTKILDSSIWLAPDPHRLVWITLLAAMDEDGNAMFACAENLAARARVTVQQAESAIKAFESPDKNSGDPENEGRRIERFPGGWHVLNAHKYRALVTKAISRERTRERVARFRAKTGNAHVTMRNEPVTPSESYAEAISDTEEKNKIMSAPPHEFEELKRIYPKRGGDQGWSKALKACHARLKEGLAWREILDGAERYALYVRATQNEGTQYVKSAAAFCGPDKHFQKPWTPPLTKGEVKQNANIDAARAWLEESSARQ